MDMTAFDSLALARCFSLNGESYIQRLQQYVVEHSHVLLPVHVNGNHWNLMYFNATEKTIYYLEPRAKFIATNQSRKLIDLLTSRIIPTSWKLILIETKWQPVSDFNNCGVIVCALARLISKQGLFAFSFVYLFVVDFY